MGSVNAAIPAEFLTGTTDYGLNSKGMRTCPVLEGDKKTSVYF